MEKETLSTKESYRALGVSASTFRRFIRDGIVKPLPTSALLKKPGKLEFLKSDIEKLKKQSGL